MYTDKQWEMAEEQVKQRALQAAYLSTEQIPDREHQRLTYRLVKDCMMMGARLMQEEITKFDNRLVCTPPMKDSLLKGDYTCETTEDF